MQQKNKYILLLNFFTLLCLTSVTIAYLTFTRQFKEQVTISNVQVRVYEEDMTEITEGYTVNWGIIQNGTLNTAIVYIKNTGNVPVTLSYISTPPTGWTETPNFNITTIQPAEWSRLILTLNIPSNAVLGQTYTWNSKIIATGG